MIPIPQAVVSAFEWLSRFFLAFLIVSGLLGLLQLVLSNYRMRAYARSLRFIDYRRFLDSEHAVPVSLILPIGDDASAEDALDTLEHLLALDFPEFEVIAVVYGSSADVLERLSDTYRLLAFRQPYKRSLTTGEIKTVYRSIKNLRLIVAEKPNGDRADALNAGLNLSSYPIVLSTQPRVLFEPDALIKIDYSFVSDPLCVAVGGVTRSACEEPSNWLERRPLDLLQRMERLRAFYTNRHGAERAGALLSVCDSFFAFKKSALLDAGGFRSQAAGEEGDALMNTLAILRDSKRRFTTRLLPDPICTVLPQEQLRGILAERRRWNTALCGLLTRFGKLAFRWPSKQAGPIGLPYFWLLDRVSPLLETAGFLLVPAAWLLGATDGWFVLIYLALSVLFGAALSLGSVLLEESTFQSEPQAGMLLWLFLYSFVDGFWYRPVTRACRVGWPKKAKRSAEPPME